MTEQPVLIQRQPEFSSEFLAYAVAVKRMKTAVKLYADKVVSK